MRESRHDKIKLLAAAAPCFNIVDVAFRASGDAGSVPLRRIKRWRLFLALISVFYDHRQLWTPSVVTIECVQHQLVWEISLVPVLGADRKAFETQGNICRDS